MSKFMNLNASVKQSFFKVYSAINIPTKLLDGLDAHNVHLQMNSNVLIEEEEFVKRVKDCDAIVCSSFGHKIDKKLLDSAGNKLKV
jgi:hypothetical protein